MTFEYKKTTESEAIEDIQEKTPCGKLLNRLKNVSTPGAVDLENFFEHFQELEKKEDPREIGKEIYGDIFIDCSKSGELEDVKRMLDIDSLRDQLRMKIEGISRKDLIRAATLANRNGHIEVVNYIINAVSEKENFPCFSEEEVNKIYSTNKRGADLFGFFWEFCEESEEIYDSDYSEEEERLRMGL